MHENPFPVAATTMNSAATHADQLQPWAEAWNKALEALFGREALTQRCNCGL